MSSVTESAKFFQAILFSDEQDLCPHPLTHQEQLGDSTGATALEVNVGYNQEWPAFNRGDEASRPRYFDDFHATITVFPVGVHLGPQSNLPPYETQPGEQVIIQSARSCSKRPRTTRRRVRPTCTNCNKDFVRVQEFKRHLKDIHEPRSQCPFCDFTWTRPDKIKAHIMARHQGKFTAEQLVDFDALRGQKIVAFLRVQM